MSLNLNDSIKNKTIKSVIIDEYIKKLKNKTKYWFNKKEAF